MLNRSHNAQKSSKRWKKHQKYSIWSLLCLGQLICNCGMICVSSLTIISSKLHEHVNNAVTREQCLLLQAMTERIQEAWGHDWSPTPRPPCGSQPIGPQLIPKAQLPPPPDLGLYLLLENGSMTYREEIVSLLSKEPVGGSEQVLCAGPVNFAEKVLKTLVDIFTSATARA